MPLSQVLIHLFLNNGGQVGFQFSRHGCLPLPLNFNSLLSLLSLLNHITCIGYWYSLVCFHLLDL